MHKNYPSIKGPNKSQEMTGTPEVMSNLNKLFSTQEKKIGPWKYKLNGLYILCHRKGAHLPGQGWELWYTMSPSSIPTSSLVSRRTASSKLSPGWDFKCKQHKISNWSLTQIYTRVDFVGKLYRMLCSLHGTQTQKATGLDWENKSLRIQWKIPKHQEKAQWNGKGASRNDRPTSMKPARQLHIRDTKRDCRPKMTQSRSLSITSIITTCRPASPHINTCWSWNTFFSREQLTHDAKKPRRQKNLYN